MLAGKASFLETTIHKKRSGSSHRTSFTCSWLSRPILILIYGYSIATSLSNTNESWVYSLMNFWNLCFIIPRFLYSDKRYRQTSPSESIGPKCRTLFYLWGLCQWLDLSKLLWSWPVLSLNLHMPPNRAKEVSGELKLKEVLLLRFARSIYHWLASQFHISAEPYPKRIRDLLLTAKPSTSLAVLLATKESSTPFQAQPLHPFQALQCQAWDKPACNLLSPKPSRSIS